MAAALLLVTGGVRLSGPEPGPAVSDLAKSATPDTDLSVSGDGPVSIRPDGEPGPIVPVSSVERSRLVSASVPPGPVSQSGCPVPRRPPRPLKPLPGLPKGLTLVPEDQVPVPPAPPTTRTTATAVVGGRGMWTWQWGKTEGGDAAAVVRRAQAAGLSTLWVRVADSKSGFYAAAYLDRLVPLAHRAGLKVIGWGFPFLGDPVADAAWTGQALDWKSGGHRLDAFSPDLETAGEGVVVTERRVATYLGLSRRALAGRPLVATVYNPTDASWAKFPYPMAASYSDAMAPMVYWGCRDPGSDVRRAVARLSSLGVPVVPAGQSYNMAADGGRSGNPSAAETLRFLDEARKSGALGAAFWVWQDTSAEQWQAISDYSW